jgi:hypothetical protein
MITIQEFKLVNCTMNDDVEFARVLEGTAFCNACGATDHEDKA